MNRPQLTPAQLDAARFVRAELRRLYFAQLSIMAAAVGVVEVLDGYALPVPPALAAPGALGDLAAIYAGELEMGELVASAEIVAPELERAAA